MYKVVYLWMVRHVIIHGVTVPSSGDFGVLLLGGIMQTKTIIDVNECCFVCVNEYYMSTIISLPAVV